MAQTRLANSIPLLMGLFMEPEQKPLATRW